MKKTTTFGEAALFEVQGAVCDYHHALLNRSAARAEEKGRQKVGRQDVELAIEDLEEFGLSGWESIEAPNQKRIQKGRKK